MDYGNLYTNNHPSNRGQTRLGIPLFQGRLIPQATKVYPIYPYEADSLKIYTINDTMYIDFPQSRVFTALKFNIPMKADCGDTICKGGGTINVGFFHQVKYDTIASCNEPYIKFGCINKSTVLHCPCPCPPGGATPIAFNLKTDYLWSSG